LNKTRILNPSTEPKVPSNIEGPKVPSYIEGLKTFGLVEGHPERNGAKRSAVEGRQVIAQKH
ncbi:MAG: hypothetical protein V3S81_00665, partial [Anaerolineales bacterium]